MTCRWLDVCCRMMVTNGSSRVCCAVTSARDQQRAKKPLPLVAPNPRPKLLVLNLLRRQNRNRLLQQHRPRLRQLQSLPRQSLPRPLRLHLHPLRPWLFRTNLVQLSPKQRHQLKFVDHLPIVNLVNLAKVVNRASHAKVVNRANLVKVAKDVNLVNDEYAPVAKLVPRCRDLPQAREFQRDPLRTKPLPRQLVQFRALVRVLPKTF